MVSSKYWLTFVFVFFLSWGISANETSIVTRTSTNDIFLSDTVVLEIDVTNPTGPPEVSLPDLPDVRFRQKTATVSSSSTYIINGKVTKSEIQTLQVEITPLTTGVIAVPELTVETGQQTFRTSSFSINVEPPPASENMLLRVTQDERDIYVNQTVTFRLNWYLLTNLADYSFLFSPFGDSDTWQFIPTLPKQGEKTIKVDRFEVPFTKKQTNYKNNEYTLYSIPLTFRALKPGNKIITPPVVKALTDEGDQYQTDIFGRPIKVPRKNAIFAMVPSLKVNVNELPKANRPAQFDGAVGNFAINVYSDVREAAVEDKLPLTLEITGKGFPGYAPEKIPLRSKVLRKDYDISLRTVTQSDDAVFKADYYVVPKHTGIREIPAISLPFFDPRTKTYRQAKTKPIALSIRRQEVIGVNDISYPNGNRAENTDKTDAQTESRSYPVIMDRGWLNGHSDVYAIAAGVVGLPAVSLLVGVLYVRRLTGKRNEPQDRLPEDFIFAVQPYLDKAFSGDTFTTSELITIVELLETHCPVISEAEKKYRIDSAVNGETHSEPLEEQISRIISEAEFLRFAGLSDERELDRLNEPVTRTLIGCRKLIQTLHSSVDQRS